MLVHPYKTPVSASGITLPEEIQEYKRKGHIVALHPNDAKKFNLKIGDLVYVMEFLAYPIEQDDKSFHFIKTSDILGKETGYGVG